MRPETRASVEAQQTTIPFDWEIGYHNPFPGEKNRNVVAQYQRAWDICLAGDYDALLTVEHDMVLPPDAVQKLYYTDAPVVYGVYMLRHGTKTLNVWQYVNNRNLGMSLSLYPAELRQLRKQGWGEVSGTGWGCTLIRREVLQRLTVHSNGDDAGDLTFSVDCLRAGFKQIARFDVPCGHIDDDGTVLDPYRMGGIVSRVYALQDVTVGDDGRSVAMKKGRYYSITPNTANELVRAGYVRITNDDADGEIETATDAKAETRETATAPTQRKRRKTSA